MTFDEIDVRLAAIRGLTPKPIEPPAPQPEVKGKGKGKKKKEADSTVLPVQPSVVSSTELYDLKLRLAREFLDHIIKHPTDSSNQSKARKVLEGL